MFGYIMYELCVCGVKCLRTLCRGCVWVRMKCLGTLCMSCVCVG